MEIALKLMCPALMRFDAYRQQFEREAAIGATLHHPHICQVLDRGEDDVACHASKPLRVSYLCLQTIAGGNIGQRIQDGPIPLIEISVIVERVAEALDYAHRHGVVHGDVKPSAIVFNEDGHVHLTDFAFAQRVLNAADGQALGSPAYLAPEVWEHGALDPITDQYALAVVAYHAIAGSLLFGVQENPLMRRKNFAHGPLAAHLEASSYRSDVVPVGVSAVPARALAVSPEQRFECRPPLQVRSPPHQREAISLRYGEHLLELSARRKRGVANYFAKELKEHNIATFLDVQRVERAQRFPDRLSQAIQDCDVFVCLLGQTTLQSEWVAQEIGMRSIGASR